MLLHIDGARINWFPMDYGYRNYDDLNDNSRNTLAVGFVFIDDLMQHCHHSNPVKPNDSFKELECDLLFSIINPLANLSIIRLSTPVV